MKHYVLVSVLLVTGLCSATYRDECLREQEADKWALQQSVKLGDFQVFGNDKSVVRKPRCLRGKRGSNKTWSEVIAAYARAQNKK